MREGKEGGLAFIRRGCLRPLRPSLPASPRARIEATALLVSTHRHRVAVVVAVGVISVTELEAAAARSASSIRPRLSVRVRLSVRPSVHRFLSSSFNVGRSALLSKYSLALSLSLVTRL